MTATQSEIKLTHKELAAMLLRQYKIHEGFWQLTMTFGFSATNAGPSEEEVMPAVVVGVQAVGLTRSEKKGPITFDAAELNPKK